MFQHLEDTLHYHVTLFRCSLSTFLDELAFLSRASEQFLAILVNMGLTHEPRARCPPKWRFNSEATPLHSFAFALDVPVGVASPLPINASHGFVDDRVASVAGLWGYGGSLAGCVLLWILLFWRSSNASDFWTSRAGTRKTPNLDRHVIGYSARGPTYDGAKRLIAGVLVDLPGRAFAGAWKTERHVRRAITTLQKLIWDASLALLAQIRTMTWTRVLDPSADRPNDAITLTRNSEGGRSRVSQERELSERGLHTAVLAENESAGPAANRLVSESSLSIRNLSGSTTAVHDSPHLPSAINHVAVGPIPAQVTAPEKVRGDTYSWRKIGSALVDAAKVNLNLNTILSPDGDDCTSELGSAGSGDEESLGVSTLEGKGECGVLGSPLLLRRARSVEHPWRKRDVDDDERTGEDSYWTDQVYRRLSGEFRARCRSNWSDAPSWAQEGREDESGNWRSKNSHDVQARDNKHRRYSSPCLNVNASPSHRTDNGDAQVAYVIPQKRGGGQSWLPASSPRLCDAPSGLGFLPCRKTTLLTPTAWKPGCLYIPDPPEDESRQAAAWWGNLTSTGSTAGHVTEPVHTRAVLFARDRLSDGLVSWRDRYDNDPASRRFLSAHRRAVTDG